MTPLLTHTVDAAPRSVDYLLDQLLVGTSTGTILELKGVVSNPTAPEEVVQIRSHGDGETWGLTMIREDGIWMYLTSGDDNKLLLHDIKLRKVVGDGVIQTVADIKSLPKKKKIGGASSQSSMQPHQQSRALAYNFHLNHLAVGHNDGAVSIRQVEGIEEAASGDANVKLDNIQHVIKDPKEWIEVIEYNSDGTKLAIGSHDNRIYVYNTTANCKYKRAAVLKGHSSYITAVDWSLDSSYLRSTCGAYELLFWSPDSKKQDPSGASNTVGTDWMNHSCKFGWRVDGIYPPGTDGTHVNRVEMSPD